MNLENQSWSLYRQCNLITLLIKTVKNQYIHELYTIHLAMVDSIGYVIDSFRGHSAQSENGTVLRQFLYRWSKLLFRLLIQCHWHLASMVQEFVQVTQNMSHNSNCVVMLESRRNKLRVGRSHCVWHYYVLLFKFWYSVNNGL